MTPPLRLPVIDQAQGPTWPDDPTAPEVPYKEVQEALRVRPSGGAFFSAYDAADRPYRLSLTALPRLATGLGMQLFVVVVASPRGQASARWRQHEAEKLRRIDEVHPGGFAYATPKGLVVVWRLAQRYVLRSLDDEAAWRMSYWRWLAYLARTFELVGDPRCAAATSLFQAPCQEGLPADVTGPIVQGDPAAPGVWHRDATATDLSADLATIRALASRSLPGWTSVVHELDAAADDLPVVVSGPGTTALIRNAESYTAMMRPLWVTMDKARALADEAYALVRGFCLGARHAARLLLLPRSVSPRWTPSEVAQVCQEAAATNSRNRPWGYLASGAPREELNHDGPLPVRTATIKTLPRAHAATLGQVISPPRAEDNRPRIWLGLDLESTIEQAAEALSHASDVYHRGTELMEVLSSHDPALGTTLHVRKLPLVNLRAKLSSVALWIEIDARGYERYTGPSDVVTRGVAAKGVWPALRPLQGIASTPFLRVDGSVCDRQGYDADSGYLLQGPWFPAVPRSPSREDARRALAELVDLFSDFPFVNEASRHLPVAALLTLLAQPALVGANIPAFLFDASGPANGKTLLVDIVALLALGHLAAKMDWRSNDELEKIFTSAARIGERMLCFDNIPPASHFGGSAVELVLTCGGLYQSRLLHQSAAPKYPWNTVIFGTGNNLRIRNDALRRVLVSRQRSSLERPELRTGFKYADLKAEARARRPDLVCAALTLLRAHSVAGAPPMVPALGSFEEWSRRVASALVWAGGPNVLETLPTLGTDHDPTLEALRALLRLWPRLDRDGVGLTVAQLKEIACDSTSSRAASRSPLQEEERKALREYLETLAPRRGHGGIDPQRLGHVFREHKDRVFGGLSLREGNLLAGARRWRVVREGSPPRS